MNKLTAAVANSLSFAHLARIGRPKAAAKADDVDDKKDDADEDDEKDKKSKAKASDDDEPDAKAEKDDDAKDDEHASADDDDEDDKGKKAKAKADDGDKEDDKDDEMRGNSHAARARRREQARCAAIFASPAAARNPQLAANLAFKTRMPRDEAVVLLEGSPPAAQASHAGRADRNPRIGAGGSIALTSAQAVDGSWDRAFAKTNGRRR